jgi:hypothetical protein
VATPALALLAALGLWLLGRLLLSLWQEAGEEVAAAYRPYLLPALLVVATLLTLSDLSYYFGRYRAQPDFADLNTEVADRMGHYLNELGEEWSAYFYGPPRMYVGFPNITFLASGHQSGYNLFDMDTVDGSLPTAVSHKRVFIYLPERLPELEAIQNQYPAARCASLTAITAAHYFLPTKWNRSALRGDTRGHAEMHGEKQRKIVYNSAFLCETPCVLRATPRNCF